MTSTTTATTAALSALVLADGRPKLVGATPHSISLPALSPPPRIASSRTGSSCRRISRNIVARATREAPTEVTTEFPEITKNIQDLWDRIEDKYAVSSLAVAGLVALWVSTGMISAIDRLPLVPGVLELVGIGYTGWFVYCNLVFKPDREALIGKIKSTYCDIIGSS